ncbi:hypothetical protein [Pedobacter montanisoli]|uniref:DUF5004 domain-containing protein n=1 Tax=Pedobacter montanisoli TaxID=2923277 RepID=A0ABS9ZWI3_9SPHI|nr:hypothetical protein [Pedobacter montanisoli]MCJ0742647.1 hypothetical protein [Pedobacter montanisoli]
MYKLRYFLLCVVLLGFGCKREKLDDQQFVQKYLTGKWSTPFYVKIDLKNGDTVKKDTVKFKSADTVFFTSSQKFVKHNDSIGFQIDAAGENIAFMTNPDSTWYIPYVRSTYFKLIYSRKVVSGTDTFYYKIEQQFNK